MKISVYAAILSLAAFTCAEAQIQTFTFTNCGATGRLGPQQSQVNTAYASTNLNGSVVVTASGIQQFTVPSSGLYQITAMGASGGDATSGPAPGLGAIITGEFNLQGGDVLQILVGQMGQDRTTSAGGGGGSFVTKTPHNTNASILVIAGGGGASSADFPGLDAVTASCGTFDINSGPGQCNGSGGLSFTGNSGGGGGGFFTDGQNGGIGQGGKAYVNGGAGGTTNNQQEGGFGGGGGQDGSGTYAASAGGGYSGGNGGNRSVAREGGGGGGSLNNGVNQMNSIASTTGHGIVIISSLCNIDIQASTNPICIGSSVVLTTNADNNIMWNTGATTNSITVTPTATTVYSVTGSSSLNCTSSSLYTVVVNPLPVITGVSSPTTLCAGAQATLTAFGAQTYTWTNIGQGQTVTVNPPGSSLYTVTGTDASGCENDTVIAVSVNSNSLTTTPDSQVCEGGSIFLQAAGANTYTWSTGLLFSGITVTPSTQSNYTVSGTDEHNCVLSKVINVQVVPNPTLVVTASPSAICKGETATLTVSGADSYTWSTNETGMSIEVTPAVDVTYHYTVTGSSVNGCTGTSVLPFTVNRCTDIRESTVENTQLYPNPSHGIFEIVTITEDEKTVKIFDMTGRQIKDVRFSGRKSSIDLSNLPGGLYYIQVNSLTGISKFTIIKI